jgi:hypothetical protein
MCFAYRSADYRHQVLEISAPVSMQGETATAFGRCAAEVSAAIRKSPAHWVYWTSTADLATLGVAPADEDAAPAADCAPRADEEFLIDRAADQVPVPG